MPNIRDVSAQQLGSPDPFRADTQGSQAWTMAGRRINQGYNEIGQAVEGVGKILQEHQDNIDLAAQAKKQSDAEVVAMKTFADWKQTADLTKLNAISDFMADKVTPLLEGAKIDGDPLFGGASTKVQAQHREWQANAYNTIGRMAVGEYSKFTEDKHIADIEGTVDNYRAMAAQNGELGPELAKRVDAFKGLDPLAAKTMKAHILGGTLDNALNAGITNIHTWKPENYDALITHLKKMDEGGVMSTIPDQTMDTIDKLERMKETAGAKDDLLNKRDIAAGTERARATGTDPGGQTAALIAKQKPEERELYAQVLKEAVHEGQVRTTVGNEPKDAADQDLSASLDRYKSAPIEQVAGLKADYAVKAQVLGERDDAFSKGQGADYVQANNPAVASAFKQFAQNPNADTFNKAVDLSFAEQSRLYPPAITGIQPRILTAELQGNIQSSLARVATAENGTAQASQLLQDYAKMAGPRWNQLSQELFHAKVLNDTQYVAASLEGRPAAQGLALELVNASKIDPKEEVAGGPLSRKAADTAAAAAIFPLRKSLEAGDKTMVAGGTQLADAYQNAISNLLMYRSKNTGTNEVSQAKDIARQVVLNNYTFDGSLRVPQGVGVTASQANGALSGYTSKLADNKDLVVPPSYTGLGGTDQRANFLASLHDSGHWVANGDESGAVLVDASGRTVMINRGKTQVPYSVPWTSIKASAKPWFPFSQLFTGR